MGPKNTDIYMYQHSSTSLKRFWGPITNAAHFLQATLVHVVAAAAASAVVDAGGSTAAGAICPWLLRNSAVAAGTQGQTCHLDSKHADNRLHTTRSSYLTCQT